MELNRQHWTKAAWVHYFSLLSSLNKPTWLMSSCVQLQPLWPKAGFLLPCLGQSHQSRVCRHRAVLPPLQPGVWQTTNKPEENSQKKINKQNKTPKHHFC